MTRYGYLSESIEDEQVRLSNENASAYCDSMHPAPTVWRELYPVWHGKTINKPASVAARPVERDEHGVAWVCSPRCSCCGKRGLVRLRPHEYRCPRTRLEMRFFVRDGGYFPVPLKTAQAMDVLGRDSL